MKSIHYFPWSKNRGYGLQQGALPGSFGTIPTMRPLAGQTKLIRNLFSKSGPEIEKSGLFGRKGGF
jgi:hypothetical protein